MVISHIMSTSSLLCMDSIKRMNNERPTVTLMYSDTVFHGDNSASMSSMGDSPSMGARTFVEKYKHMSIDLKSDIHLVFGVFSDKYIEVYNGNPKDMTDEEILKCEQSMNPKDMTKFYDTTIEQLVNQGKRIEKKYNELSKETRNLVPLDKYANVVFAILTDGVDNASYEHDSEALKEYIHNHKTKYNASILFMAANMSAIDVGNKYGLNKEDCLQMGSDPTYSLNAMNSLTNVCSRRASNSGDMLITPLMRSQSCSQDELDTYNSINIPINIPKLSRMTTISQMLPTIDFNDSEY